MNHGFLFLLNWLLKPLACILTLRPKFKGCINPGRGTFRELPPPRIKRTGGHCSWGMQRIMYAGAHFPLSISSLTNKEEKTNKEANKFKKDKQIYEQTNTQTASNIFIEAHFVAQGCQCLHPHPHYGFVVVLSNWFEPLKDDQPLVSLYPNADLSSNGLVLLWAKWYAKTPLEMYEIWQFAGKLQWSCW